MSIYFDISASKANGSIMSSELKDQLDDAAMTTSKVFNQLKCQRTISDEGGGLETGQSQIGGDETMADKNKEKDSKTISPEIAVMQPILRFFQLLCENHNRELQVSVNK